MAAAKTLDLTAVRPHRRRLLAKARKGELPFRVFGSAKEWFVGIDTGKKIVRLNDRKFLKMGTAIGFVFAKHGQKATQYKQLKMAA